MDKKKIIINILNLFFGIFITILFVFLINKNIIINALIIFLYQVIVYKLFLEK